MLGLTIHTGAVMSRLLKKLQTMFIQVHDNMSYTCTTCMCACICTCSLTRPARYIDRGKGQRKVETVVTTVLFFQYCGNNHNQPQ